MAYLDEDHSSNVGRRVGLFVAVAAAILAAKFVMPDLIRRSEEWPPEKVAAQVEKETENPQLFAAIKANYPDEYRAFIDKVTHAAQIGHPEEMRYEAFSFIDTVMTNHFKGLIKAPSRDIRAIAEQRALLLHALQRTDVRLCAQYITEDGPSGTEPPSEAVSILDRAAAARVAASRAGEIHPGEPRGRLSDSDFGRFRGALEARFASADRLLANSQAVDRASVDDQCTLGVAIYDTIVDLPPDLGAAVMIHLLRRPSRPDEAAGETGT